MKNIIIIVMVLIAIINSEAQNHIKEMKKIENRYEIAKNDPLNARIYTLEIGRAHSELQSRRNLVCRLLLEKKKTNKQK